MWRSKGHHQNFSAKDKAWLSALRPPVQFWCAGHVIANISDLIPPTPRNTGTQQLRSLKSQAEKRWGAKPDSFADITEIMIKCVRALLVGMTANQQTRTYTHAPSFMRKAVFKACPVLREAAITFSSFNHRCLPRHRTLTLPTISHPVPPLSASCWPPLSPATLICLHSFPFSSPVSQCSPSRPASLSPVSHYVHTQTPVIIFSFPLSLFPNPPPVPLSSADLSPVHLRLA